jgi:hypothetical protein
MRRKLALGILLMAVIGVTDLPSCDSGCRSVPKKLLPL